MENKMQALKMAMANLRGTTQRMTMQRKRPGITISIMHDGAQDPEIEALEEKSGLDLDKDEGKGEDSGEKPYSKQTPEEKSRGELLLADFRAKNSEDQADGGADDSEEGDDGEPMDDNAQPEYMKRLKKMGKR